MPEKVTKAEKELYTISHLIKKKHYGPILLGNANGILGKANYCTLKILLGSGASYSIVLGKHPKKLRHKKTQPVKWSTQGCELLTTYKTNV